MATIRAYTTIEQSKVLAEILSLESADMIFDGVGYKLGIPKVKPCGYVKSPNTLPCWSLAALLEELNRNCWKVSLKCCGAEWDMTYDDGERYISVSADYAIDACYEMILKLNKLNLL